MKSLFEEGTFEEILTRLDKLKEGLLFRKSMYSDRPWRKNLPTAPFAKAREPKQVSEELPILKQMVREFHALKDREHWNPHPIFGEFTREQWGQMQYKHLDHHLTQFGV